MRVAVVTAALLGLPMDLLAQEKGAAIFARKCAACHGENGEGTKHTKRRLEGDRSIAQLAAVIQKTMPEDDPGSLSANDAKAVARYIHGAFYSRIARERNRPPRIELSRLTVDQYRSAVADLFASFNPPTKRDESPGLQAEYYRKRQFHRGRVNRRDRVFTRTDTNVDFDFGKGSPDKRLPANTFSIRWFGSVIAEETGEYEFIVQTNQAMRLYVNDREPLINAWVKSGKDTVFKGSTYLIAGREYGIKLEFSKATQGVQNQKNDRVSKPAFVKLLWKRPRGVASVIPARNLRPSLVPIGFACRTRFPPDDKSYGWIRGTDVSKEWDEATTNAAIEAAKFVDKHLARLSLSRDNDPNRAEKVREFCRQFLRRAFRSPLPADVEQKMIDRQFVAAKGDINLAAKRVVLLALKSPRFLYRDLETTKGHRVAARLSFGLWNSIPDAELLRAAAAGELATRPGIRKQIGRMMTDPRARLQIREFLLAWLHIDHERDLRKSAKLFAGFDSHVIADLNTSLDRFLDEVVWSEKSDFRRLVLSDELFVNDRLAKFFSLPKAPREFSAVRIDNGKRAGVLTHPLLMTTFSHGAESSPIHRGVFLARGVLGVSLKPPPFAVTPLSPKLHPDLTTRQRVALQTKSSTCMTCHGIINELGFTLEQFDAVGRFREKEHGKPIDARGKYVTRAGTVARLDGARALGKFIANSEEAHTAFVEQLFHHLVRQPVRAYGKGRLEQLTKSFAANQFHIRKLVASILEEAAVYEVPTQDDKP